MKKIGLLYLNETNLGDIVIYETSRYLTEMVCKNNNIDYTIIPIDIGLNTPKSYVLSEKDKKIKTKNATFIRRCKKYLKSVKILEKELIFKKWQTTNYYFNLKANILPQITKDFDLLIFVGGGILKYKQQEFLYIIDEITKKANKEHIPVIFNSVGIEGYDKNDKKCQILKKAINRKCVKAISTRDYIDILNNNYIENKKLYTSLAADPALYSSECYNIKKSDSKTIGIGLIRPNIFKEYMYDIDEDFLLNLYKEIIDEIIDIGYKPKVFINGTYSDYKMQQKLLELLKDNEKYNNIFIEQPKSGKELIKIISSFKGTIVSRLHASIISYALDIPSVGLVWNNKQIMFGKIINCEKNFIQKENFNAKYIVNQLISNFNNKNFISKDYKKTVYNFLDKAITDILIKK